METWATNFLNPNLLSEIDNSDKARNQQKFKSSTFKHNWCGLMTMQFQVEKKGHFQKLSQDFENLQMTSDELEKMFEGDFADTCRGKLPPQWMMG